MTGDVGVFTVAGPVQAEIMVLAVVDGELVLTGPCGAAPWYVEVTQGTDPTAIVTAITELNLGRAEVVHSTSWRLARGGVVLTFLAVVEAATTGALERVRVERADVVRGGATAAPALVPVDSVIEHGLRHLAWLASDDPAVVAALPAGWMAVLDGYVPEPFRRLLSRGPTWPGEREPAWRR